MYGTVFSIPNNSTLLTTMMMMMMDDDADDAMIRVDDGDRCAILVAVAAVEGRDAEPVCYSGGGGGSGG